MGLFQKAVDTYDNMKNLVGEESEERKTVLAPIGFITTDVQIAITVTEKGEFANVEVFTDGKGKTIMIPATEKSAGRTGSSAKTTPHPLCDKLMFMCPDCKESYDAYLTQLQDWCDSEFACSKIKTILAYVKKGTIRMDISSVSEVKNDNFVCWRVLSTECTEPEEIWRSRSVINSYVSYCQSKANASSENALCYVTGEFTTPAQQHLKGVVSSYGNAKLISANDTENFTYKGRFLNDDEALTVGFLSSQKAHNALKWVVSNDGFRFGDRVIASWNPKGKKVRNPAYSLFSNFIETKDILWDIICRKTLCTQRETMIIMNRRMKNNEYNTCEQD